MDKPGDGPVTANLQLLSDVCDNDTEEMKFIVGMFFEQMPIIMADIEAGITAQDWDRASKSAHKAKSSLSIIDVSTMLDLAKTIEQKAKHAPQSEELTGLLNSMKAAFEEGKKILAAHFQLPG
jgi:HPt (histidine-containing phosphotransfer) domain-containing protein